MDWTEEDTRLLQLINRVRHLISVRDPEGFRRCVIPNMSGWVVRTTVGSDFMVELANRGQRLIVYDVRNGRTGTLLDVRFDRKRPQHAGSTLAYYAKGLAIVWSDVLPAIDREMVLEDLSMLGG